MFIRLCGNLDDTQRFWINKSHKESSVVAPPGNSKDIPTTAIGSGGFAVAFWTSIEENDCSVLAL
jgi:hypothetical protein